MGLNGAVRSGAVQLVGTVDLGDGFRISAPGLTGEVSLLGVRDEPGEARDPSDPAGRPAFEALERALIAHTTSVRTVEVTPRSIRRLKGPLAGAAADPFIQLQVRPSPGQGALVLVQDELGLLAWHSPRPVTARAGRVSSAELTFQIPVTAARSALLGTGGWLKKVLKVAFFDLAQVNIGPVGRYLVGRWEEENRPTRLRWFTPAGYGQPAAGGDLITRQELAALSGAETLLFVHGALGTSHGGFGGMPAEDMARLWERYSGRVLAFDHATVADSPQRNVERLLELLPPGFAGTFDVVCQGRGGLVARVLAGELGGTDDTGRAVRVRRVTFAGTEDRSSALSDAEQVSALVDHLTNAMATLPSAGPASMLGDVLEALVGAAKLVASSVAPNPPGLVGGRFMRDPDGRRAGGAVFFGIPSDVESTDARMLALVRGFIAGGTVDWVFGQVPDDLVVPDPAETVRA